MTDTFQITPPTFGGDGTQAVIDTAQQAVEPQPLDPANRFYAIAVPANGKVEVVDLEQKLDLYRDTPRRATGAYQVHDSDSFLNYITKHGLPETEVWADVTRNKLTAVINAHAGTDAAAGWGDHRVTFEVKLTDAWKTWLEHDGKLLEQIVFAELIENRMVDIVEPTSADMLELAQSFEATIGMSFESSRLLSNGERQLAYKENIAAKAGQAGQLEIPKSFTLRLQPFEGAGAYDIVARYRYRITDGKLRVGYVLERPAEKVREAFLDVVTGIEDSVTGTVFRGVAP